MGAALLDLDEPWRVVARGRDYLLSPQVPYEQVGDVPNVVFPCAALVESRDRQAYGLLRRRGPVVCLAHGHLSEIVDFVRGYRKPAGAGLSGSRPVAGFFAPRVGRRLIWLEHVLCRRSAPSRKAAEGVLVMHGDARRLLCRQKR